MKKLEKQKYMMGTKAIHKLGDISSDAPDLCIIHSEDDENYIGNWVSGFGFIDVKFPKTTTRELNEQEIEKYHGEIYYMGSDPLFALNLKNERFDKRASIHKSDGSKSYFGTLQSPIKVGKPVFLFRDDGGYFRSSTVKEIDGRLVKTVNSTYEINIYE